MIWCIANLVIVGLADMVFEYFDNFVFGDLLFWLLDVFFCDLVIVTFGILKIACVI